MILLSEKIIITIAVLATIIFIVTLKIKKIEKTKAKALFLIYINFIICLCISYYLKFIFNPIHLCMGMWIIFSLVNMIILKTLKLYDNKYSLYFIMSIIFVVQLGYISYTSYGTRQHDLRSFYNYENGGHLGYIGYIFNNNHLPIGSPKDFWCFYNPPLFYIVSAIFIKLQNFFGIELESCLENLQILSLFYIMTFNIFVYKILKEMNIEKSIAFIISFIGLAPAMIMMSGSLGNGPLSIMLSTIAIYYTIKWYKSDTLKDLVIIAFAISFAIMTKIDAALIAVAIGVTFIIKLGNNRKEVKKYIKYFSLFALISLPIGLWYPIKNLVLYDIPITYVQSVERDHEASTEKYSILDRFFSVESKDTFDNVNVTMVGEKMDYNIFVTTIKSFIVDEEIQYENNKILDICVHLIFFLSLLLPIIFILNVIYVISNYKKINNPWILFFMLIFLLEVLAYLRFCFEFPFVFTMNFRYIVPSLISFGVITGIASEYDKTLYLANKISLSIFSLLSIGIFLILL